MLSYRDFAKSKRIKVKICPIMDKGVLEYLWSWRGVDFKLYPIYN